MIITEDWNCWGSMQGLTMPNPPRRHGKAKSLRELSQGNNYDRGIHGGTHRPILHGDDGCGFGFK